MRTQFEATTVPPPASVAVELLTSRRDFATLAGEWDDLVRSSADPNVFLTWAWVSTWCATVAADAELRVLAVRDPSDGSLVGMAPFVVQRRPGTGPTLWRELVFMGCTESAPDHLTCIARVGWEASVARVVADWLRAGSLGTDWDLIRLDGMRPDAPLLRELLDATEPAARAIWPVACPYIPLPSTWEEYEAGLSKKFSRNTRRRLRKLEREANGPVRFETVTGGEGLEEAYADLVRLHASVRRERGERGAFRSDTRREFYGAVVRRFGELGGIRIHRLTVGGEGIATALCFVYGGKTWCYQMGYDLGMGQYGPGYLIVRRVIQAAIEEGCREVDMLRGDHPYKYEWNAEPRTVLKARIGSTARGRVVAPVTRWLRSARHEWKEWRGPGTTTNRR